AGGHIDGLAAAFGLLGIVALRVRTPAAVRTPAGDGTPRPGIPALARPVLARAGLAGLLIGVATGLKVEYALLGLAVAWACCRSSRGSGGRGGVVPPGAGRARAAAAAGFAGVIGPAYLGAGAARVRGPVH